MQHRLTALEADSAAQVAAVRVSEAEMRVEQDIGFRAEWVERRARVAEEAAWSLSASAALALAGDRAPVVDASRLAADAHGHLWTEIPEEESMAFVSGRAENAEAARRQVGLTRVLAPLMAELRRRRPAIRDVSIWTADGAVRHSPWLDFHRANRESGGELERFVFNRVARFPAARPATGDEAVWTGVYAGPSITADPRTASVFVPVRNAAGALVAGIALDLDPRRYVAEAFETWQPPGDIWFATDAAGHALLITPRAAAALGWSGVGGTVIAEAPSPELKKLAARALRGQRSAEQYVVDGKALRIASARVGATGWVLFEGFSREAVDTIRGEAVRAFPPASYSRLRNEVLLLFALLSLAVLGTIGIVSRRVSAPWASSSTPPRKSAGGRSVCSRRRGLSGDELGRLATAIDTMGKRVARRVETLRRLHDFSRSAYRMTDFKEVLGRSTQAIAAFTNAERVWFYLYDRNTNRLEAALPAWNLPEEIAARLKVSVDARSIAGMVFRTGEAYCANDLGQDPYTNRDLQKLVGAENAVFVPLKTEEETLGVAVAINRPGGFGQEEIDAVTSFADLASLLLRNARLYTTLVGTVDELRRASRLKDHFLQNVNHELRTPLTAIVGWTDLFEEEEVDEKTLRRGCARSGSRRGCCSR